MKFLMNATNSIVGRKKYLFTRPDGTVVVEKPSCCRRIFPETENMNKNHRKFGKKEYDVSNREKWNRLTRKEEHADDWDYLLKAESVVADIEDLLKENSS